MRALVIADGSVPVRAALDAAWPGWSDGIGLVVAADGGALNARRLGVPLDLVVGDMDSLPPPDLDALRTAGVAIETASPDKDESDTELAVLAAVARGARSITVLGAFGGARLDHALANIALLALTALVGREAELLDAGARVSLLATDGASGPVTRRLRGRAGDLVSLLPFGSDAEGIVTDGLRYPLRGETLSPGPARGISNVRLSEEACVTLARGRLLIVETPATLSP